MFQGIGFAAQGVAECTGPPQDDYGTGREAVRWYVISVLRTVPAEPVMRAVKLLLTACGFTVYVLGLIGLSALTTSVAHWAFYARPVPPSLAGD